MTGPVRKLSISVPPDVAAALDAAPNASAYVTAAVRDRQRLDAVRAELAHAGIQVTEQGLTDARARRAAVDAEWPPERYDEVRDRVRQRLRSEEHSLQEPAA